jgi:hypothetical protein
MEHDRPGPGVLAGERRNSWKKGRILLRSDAQIASTEHRRERMRKRCGTGSVVWIDSSG